MLKPLSRWLILLTLANHSIAGPVDLSEGERAWRAEHPVVRLAPYSNYAPAQFLDENGVHRGLAADYLQRIEALSGLSFTNVITRTWDELIETTRSGDADAIALIAHTDEREVWLVFSEPYLNLPAVILGRGNQATELGIADLVGKRVGVTSGYAVQEYLEQTSPELVLLAFPDTATGMRSLSFGAIDFFISDLAVASQVLESEGLSNLSIVGESGYVYEMGFGVRKDWPELASIINKALAQIGPEERQAIVHKWFYADDPFVRNRATKIPDWLLGALAVIVSLVLLSVAWSFSLNKKVGRRTEQWVEEFTAREEIERQKQTSELLLREIIDLMPHLIFAKDAQGKFFLVNQALADWFDKSTDETLHQAHQDLHGNEEEMDMIMAQDLEVLESGNALFLDAETFVDAKGHLRIMQTSKIPFTRPDTGEKAVLGVSVDITRLKEIEHELALHKTRLEELVDARTADVVAAVKASETASRQRDEADAERLILEAEIDSLFTLSVDMWCIIGPDEYIKRMNPAWARTLDWSEEELKKHPFIDFIHPDDRDSMRREFARLNENHDTLYLENRFRCKDGSYRYLIWSATRDSQTRRVYAAARDATELREAQSREMHDERHRVMFESVGAACHHLAQPLTAATANVELLRDELPDDDPVRAELEDIFGYLFEAGNILKKLHNVAVYKTVPYANDGRILDIEKDVLGTPAVPDASDQN